MQNESFEGSTGCSIGPSNLGVDAHAILSLGSH